MAEIGVLEAELNVLRDELRRFVASNTETHKELYGRVGALESKVSGVDEKLRNIEDKIDALTEMVNNMRDKPTKRWESVVDKIILCAIGAIVGFIMVRVGFA